MLRLLASAALALAALMTLLPWASAASLPPPTYFAISPGAVSEDPAGPTTNFSVTEFVLAEPVGLPANYTTTEQAWQSLQVVFVGSATPFVSWSVSGTAAGRFVLDLNLTDAQVAQLEGGDTLLSLTGEVVVGNATIGAAGTISGLLLESAAVPSGFWKQWFGIPEPPGFDSPRDVIETLADLNDSVAGRALYMAVTIIAATVYLYSAHRLARERLSGRDRAIGSARSKEAPG